MNRFIGRLQLDFGDFDTAGRFAFPLADLRWVCETPGYEADILIPAGVDSLTDGLSVPRLAWWFLPPFGHRSTMAGLLHDKLLFAVLEGKPFPGAETWAKCDYHFYLALRALDEPEWRARAAWLAVRANAISYRLTGWPPQTYDKKRTAAFRHALDRQEE
jgi:hypothetical protein